LEDANFVVEALDESKLASRFERWSDREGAQGRDQDYAQGKILSQATTRAALRR
jgi:hypothetical protein